MSVVPTHPTLRYLRTRTPREPSRDFPTTCSTKVSILRFRAPNYCYPCSNSLVFSRKFDEIWGPIAAVRALGPEGSLRELDDSPVSVELVPIRSETQFDRVVAEAQQLEQSFIVVWYVSGS